MGELIFQEEPLLLADSDAVPSETIEILDGICRLVVLQHAISRDPSGNESEDGASSVSTTLLLALLAFVKSSQFTQESVLTRFFIPEKESVAAGFLEALHQAVKHMCERSLISLPELAPLAAKLDFNGPMEVLDAVAMIAHCNIFAVSDDGSCAALCPSAALLAHSCLPNANWHFSSSTRFQLRAARDIRAGEEVEHSYLQRERWCARPHRRRALRASKWMLCACDRCNGREDARGFLCARCSVGTVSLEGSEDAVRAQPCSKCQAQISGADARKMETAESNLEAEVQRVDDNFGQLATEPTMAKLEATARTLTQHWLKARIYGMLFEVHKARLEWAEAECCARARHAVASAIFPLCSSVGAWQREDIADAMAGSNAVPPALFLPEDYVQGLQQMHGSNLRPRGSSYEEARQRFPELAASDRADQASTRDGRAVLQEYLQVYRELLTVYGNEHAHLEQLAAKIGAVAASLREPCPQFPQSVAQALGGKASVGKGRGERASGSRCEDEAKRQASASKKIDLEELD